MKQSHLYKWLLSKKPQDRTVKLTKNVVFQTRTKRTVVFILERTNLYAAYDEGRKIKRGTTKLAKAHEAAPSTPNEGIAI
jgi:hypothetical protein